MKNLAHADAMTAAPSMRSLPAQQLHQLLAALDCLIEQAQRTKGAVTRLAILDGMGGAGGIVELPNAALHALKSEVLDCVQSSQNTTAGHGAGEGAARLRKRDDMSTQEAADLLQVSRPFVVSQMKLGRIPYVQLGTKRRVRMEDLRAYEQTFMRPMTKARPQEEVACTKPLAGPVASASPDTAQSPA